MKNKMELLDIHFNFNITITIFIAGIFIGGTVVGYLLTHPDKLEKLIAFFSGLLKGIFKFAEHSYVKFDIQSKVNGFVMDLYNKIPNLTPTNVKLEWINENQTPEQFVKADQLVLRMHKSSNHNKNIVNSTFAFVSYSLLRKAKKYIAKYQKDAIDIFVSYKLFEKEKYEILDEFIQEYLQDGLERDKVGEFYEKFFDIDRTGLFFPVFITEMTFLGEKVFGRKRDKEQIYEEVRKMVVFLYVFANRRLDEKSIQEYTGNYCKFAIRIVGKRFKIDHIGEETYIKNLMKIDSRTETIYLIGDKENKKFINSVVKKCRTDIGFEIFNKDEFKAKIKNRDGQIFNVTSYLVVLRNTKIEIYHNN